MFGITRCFGNRAEDFGAGGLAIPCGRQFALQPGIFLRQHDLLRDRLVVDHKAGFQALLELGHQPAEVCHLILRQGRHWQESVRSICGDMGSIHGWPDDPASPQVPATQVLVKVLVKACGRSRGGQTPWAAVPSRARAGSGARPRHLGFL
jgi:hypothetical protein